MSKNSEFCLEKSIKLAFKYSLPSVHKSLYTFNYAEFDKNVGLYILPNFRPEHTVKVTATIICRLHTQKLLT